MIRVTVCTKDNTYRGFQADGHAGYAQEGEDIYCAAVSALTLNAVNSIETLSRDPLITLEDEGLLSCEFPEELSEEGTLLMESLVLGIRSIIENGGEEYVELKTEEV